MQRLATRHDDVEVCAGAEQRRELGSRSGDLLEVVEHQEEGPVADVSSELLLRAELARDRLEDERRVLQTGELDPVHGVVG